jgi:hypothetical protein
MNEGLFSRLASYSQNPHKKSVENFTTEVIAYLINEDPVFRRAFLRHLIADRRVLRGFSQPIALTQQCFDRGIVDLVVSGRRRRLLIEVKIGAVQTVTCIRGKGRVLQLGKYVSYGEGHVAYLTTRNVPAPELTSRWFLGQFFLKIFIAVCLKHPSVS